MRVLVVDDEPALRESVRRGLVTGGWAVETAADGEEGLEMACADDFDVVVLDIMMPRRSGYEVVREMRRREVWTPVLMLTAKDGEYDEADAFDLGADDYLVKPVRLRELLARIDAVARRVPAGTAAPGVVEADDVRVDLDARRVTVGGTETALTATEFAVLAALARRPGVAVSRRQVLEEVWGDGSMAASRSLDVHVAALRAKLDRPGLLATVRGFGFRLGR